MAVIPSISVREESGEGGRVGGGRGGREGGEGGRGVKNTFFINVAATE